MDVEVEEREEVGADNLVYSNTEKTEAIQFEFLQLSASYLKFYLHPQLFFLLSYNNEEASLLFKTPPPPVLWITIPTRLYRNLTPLISQCPTHVSSFSVCTCSSSEHMKKLQPLLPS